MKVLVASRGPTLGTIIASAGHEIIDARPGDARGWVENGGSPSADVALIDLPDLDLATALVDHLQRSTTRVPIVVVEHDTPEWVVTDISVCATLAPPLSRASVLAALSTALAPVVQLGPHDRPPLSGASASPDLDVADSAQRHVDALLGVVHHLLGLDEVGQAVCEQAAEAVGADAVALLVPDDRVWRVSGGVGVRPLEQRIIVGADHWLVTHMMTHTRGAVIDRSDVARARLMNTPLASRQQLVIATNQRLEVIAIAGRAAAAFSATDLSVLNSLMTEAESALRDALGLRTLARRLARYQDYA
ncbi:MAG: hypothetical protein WCA82_05115 [Jiangellales bacterium]